MSPILSITKLALRGELDDHNTKATMDPVLYMPQRGPTEGWVICSIIVCIIVIALLSYASWTSILEANNPDDYFDEIICSEKDRLKPYNPLELATINAHRIEIHNHVMNVRKRARLLAKARTHKAVINYKARMVYTNYKCDTRVKDPLRTNFPSYVTEDARGRDPYTRCIAIAKHNTAVDKHNKAVAPYEKRIAHTKRKCDVTQSKSMEIPGWPRTTQFIRGY